jgi:curli biogenesis system outer membrane secretion channel CsgG
MSRKGIIRACCISTLAGAMLLVGCSSTSTESANRDKLTEHVGVYPPGPSISQRPRVGVPSFSVKGDAVRGSSADALNDIAADQATTLLTNSDRFMMIERTQLEKLLDEQNLEGIVKPGELAKPGQVRGVDYLLIGRVTNLRVKTVRNNKGFGLGQIGGGVLGSAGLGDYKAEEVTITTDCGVDLRLVDPTTGEIMMASQSEYQKSDTASSMGVDILGANAEAGSDIQIDDDNKGKILRLAIDDAIRKALPKIDRVLVSKSK